MVCIALIVSLGHFAQHYACHGAWHGNFVWLLCVVTWRGRSAKLLGVELSIICHYSALFAWRDHGVVTVRLLDVALGITWH